jgi:hypothetical protein
MVTNEFTTDCGKYNIRSYGNGWAYEVTNRGNGRSFFVQDSDAQTLKDDSVDFECVGVLDEMMMVMGELT